MFSKTCEYAIRATLYIALKSVNETKVGIDAICDNIEAPKAFTAKILQTLTKSDIVSSQKGVHGGFYITKNQLLSDLATVVFAIDGNDIFTKCALGLRSCSEKQPCPIHNEFKPVRDEIKAILTNSTIAEMSKKLSDGISFLKVT